jgi:hypothetical protein
LIWRVCVCKDFFDVDVFDLPRFVCFYKWSNWVNFHAVHLVLKPVFSEYRQLREEEKMGCYWQALVMSILFTKDSLSSCSWIAVPEIDMNLFLVQFLQRGCPWSPVLSPFFFQGTSLTWDCNLRRY